MGHRVLLVAGVGSVVVAASLALFGCGSGSGGIGPVDEAHGVFIDATSGNDTTGDGSRQAPYATFAKGVQEAAAAGKHLFACAGTYPEHVLLDATDDGLGIYGGFACTDWSMGGGETRVVPGDSDPALVVESAHNVTVQDVTFVTADATTGGASSIAALVDGSQGVSFEGVTLQAGRGAVGVAGAPYAQRATDGTPGNRGTDACVINPNPGAPEAVTDCGTEMSTGGMGGLAGTNDGSGQSGNNGTPNMGIDDLGIAGFGQVSPTTFDCTVGGTGGGGHGGANGANGTAGAGAMGYGMIDASGYTGESGQSGTPGHAGQGGGGGGGAMAPGYGTNTLVCTTIGANVGASGGSGGGGGCGGQGGHGGGPGGGSIALLVASSDVHIDGGSLQAQQGGAGGVGGMGQNHGSGGAPGEGGSGGAANNGCQGGAGGMGGNGGPGGGGAGGPSLGIAYTGTAPAVTNVTFTEASMPASGGLGAGAGGGTSATNAGIDGLVADQHQF